MASFVRLCSVITLFCLVWHPAATAASQQARFVSVDAATTETLFALGFGAQIVGRDDSSIYPEAATTIPAIGTGHQINAEAVLALKPTLVVGRGRAMDNPGIALIEQAGTPICRLPDSHSVEGARERIQLLAKTLGVEEAGEALITTLNADLKELEARRAGLRDKPAPRVLIIYLRPGVTMLMGEDSAAAAMVKLTGATLALEGLQGYKAMNAEAVVAARPDVILCYREGLESVGGAEALWERPGLGQTPAGEARRLVAMDDLLLAGFGPRTGKGALTLLDALFPAATAQPAP